MLTLLKVAITGNISSGKTLVCNIFKKLSVYVVIVDNIVCHLLSSHALVKEKVVNLLGKDIEEQGLICKDKVANKVFTNKQLLRKLENIIHPHVEKILEVEYNKAKELGVPIFVVEIPLLYEKKLQQAYDKVVVVNADLDVRKQRFQAKGYNEAEFVRREQHLIDLSEKVSLANYVIDNNVDISHVEEQVTKLYSTWIQ